MLHSVLIHIGYFGVWSAVGICLGFTLVLTHRFRTRKDRGQGRRFLAAELRLESAWNNSMIANLRPPSFLMRKGTRLAGREESGGSKVDSVQQSELSCDI